MKHADHPETIIEDLLKVTGIKRIDLPALQKPTVDEQGSSLNRTLDTQCPVNSI
jgi:hypothetical protein